MHRIKAERIALVKLNDEKEMNLQKKTRLTMAVTTLDLRIKMGSGALTEKNSDYTDTAVFCILCYVKQQPCTQSQNVARRPHLKIFI